MKRKGFTLVEFIVVLGIIGTVLALLVPALQSAAEAARRCQCLNNLKQIHLALQSYHGTHSVYPPGVADPGRPFSAVDATRRASWTAMLLPNAEQTAVYNAINFELAATASENQTARRTTISMWLCPDSSHARSLPPWPSLFRAFGRDEPMPEFGRSSYAACHNDVEKPIDVDDRGVLFLNSRVRAADVFDGLSQTIFVGEVFEPAADGWFLGGRSTLRNTGAAINGLDVAALGDAATAEIRQGTPQTLETLANEGKVQLPPGYVGGFGSRHRGDGAQFVFGDGSARFVRRSIDPDVFRRLGNRDDGEEVDDDAY